MEFLSKNDKYTEMFSTIKNSVSCQYMYYTFLSTNWDFKMINERTVFFNIPYLYRWNSLKTKGEKMYRKSRLEADVIKFL